MQPEALDGSVQGFSFALEQADGRLQLRALHHPDYGPVYADWDSAEMRSRIRAGKKQLLARACGLHKNPKPRLLDATAGLGRDGYTLHALGAVVTLCERQPLIAELLRDAARRAQAAFEIHNGDALELLQAERGWDVVYLDPMYPHRGKRALPGKEMQLFRELTGGDLDADRLLQAALTAVRQRVVVKRPSHAPALAGIAPTLQLSSNLARYDVYLKS